jgi:hypothetical protein
MGLLVFREREYFTPLAPPPPKPIYIEIGFPAVSIVHACPIPFFHEGANRRGEEMELSWW